MTSLDGIKGRSIQTLLRGESDSKQLDEFQATSSSVEVFGWNGLKVFVNNALYSDFYAKHRRIEPEQAPLIQESQLMGFALTRFLYVHGNVHSFIIVHCKI